MPLNFGGQKRSGVFDTVWPSANMKDHASQWPGSARGRSQEKEATEKEESTNETQTRAARGRGNGTRAREAAEKENSDKEHTEDHAIRRSNIMTSRRSCRRYKADSTLRSSQAVPHPSTNRALCRLTSEVRRDPVYSTRYGRQQTCMITVAIGRKSRECGVKS